MDDLILESELKRIEDLTSYDGEESIMLSIIAKNLVEIKHLLKKINREVI